MPHLCGCGLKCVCMFNVVPQNKTLFKGKKKNIYIYIYIYTHTYIYLYM